VTRNEFVEEIVFLESSETEEDVIAEGNHEGEHEGGRGADEGEENAHADLHDG